jgi:hypothetical protein
MTKGASTVGKAFRDKVSDHGTTAIKNAATHAVRRSYQDLAQPYVVATAARPITRATIRSAFIVDPNSEILRAWRSSHSGEKPVEA